jgi:hypothetical protein
MIDVAATDPVSEAFPKAVTHKPTARALALAAPVRVYVVAAEVSTVCVVGAAVVGDAVAAEPRCGRELSTVKLAPLTAVTLPKAPSPPKPLPPNLLPPAPGPWVWPAVGVLAGRVASPVVPGDRTPGARVPPRTEQLPFTAGEISTEAATTGPLVALGAAVGGAPVLETGWALRAWTQTPTTRSEGRATTVLVKVVVVVYVTAVWASVP